MCPNPLHKSRYKNKWYLLVNNILYVDDTVKIAHKNFKFLWKVLWNISNDMVFIRTQLRINCYCSQRRKYMPTLECTRRTGVVYEIFVSINKMIKRNFVQSLNKHKSPWHENHSVKSQPPPSTLSSAVLQYRRILLISWINRETNTMIFEHMEKIKKLLTMKERLLVI